MPRRNRVDPWSDLHAVEGRGLLTGNRGCLVDDDERVVRHHRSHSLWISCVTEFRGRRYGLARPGRWTPIFFLDDAVALAAGHRPCAACRRSDYRAYRDGVSAASGDGQRLSAAQIDRRLVAERLRPGSGLVRGGDRRTWTTSATTLPVGSVILVDPVRAPHLVAGDGIRPFDFDGWGPIHQLPAGEVEVLTPATSVAALVNGFVPLLHPSASAG